MELVLAAALGIAAGIVLGILVARRGAVDSRVAQAKAEERARLADVALTKAETELTEERAKRGAAERDREAALSRANEEGKRVEELKSAREEMKNQFAALSQDALTKAYADFLERATQTFGVSTKEAKSQLEVLVAPLKENLGKLDLATKELEQKREGAYAALRQQLTSLGEQAQNLQKETTALSTSLRGSSQRRGTWGESQLRNVVELAGMVKHCDFAEQETVEGSRPDVVVKLPGGRQIAIDAKAPLTAFLEAGDATDDAKRKEALKQYANDVRGHVKRLSSREYHDKLGSSTDFVVMFLPGDSFLAAAFEQDREIFDSAIRNKVLIATPVTLVALLRTAALYWQQHALAENAERIGEEAKELYSRIANFAEPLQAIGKELDGAVKAYNRAVGSFEGRLLPHVRKMDELGGGDPSRKPLADLTQIETSPRALKAGE
jgi:DNA recombination protein RmuC